MIKIKQIESITINDLPREKQEAQSAHDYDIE